MVVKKERKKAVMREGDRIAVKLRFYPTKRQEEYIDRNIRGCMYVYNYFLAMNKRRYATEKKFINTKEEMTLHIKDMKKKPQYAWLNKIPAMALNHSLDSLAKAFKNFNARGSKRKVGFPKFKKHGKLKSFTISGKGQIHYNETTGEFRFAGVRALSKTRAIDTPVNIVWHKGLEKLPSFPTQYTVSRDPSGRYFISFLCPVKKTPLKPVLKAIGADLGISSLLICDDGTKFENEKYYRSIERKLRVEQRKLQRKKDAGGVRGKNYQKQKKVVAKLHAKVLDKRKNRWHSISKQLVEENQIICVESLNIKGMLSNKKRSKSTSDAGWGMFLSQLAYKAKFAGREVIKIDRFFPSSQKCSTCGYQNKLVKNTKVRSWTCPECGSHHDRDINAAINIKKEGLRIRQEES